MAAESGKKKRVSPTNWGNPLPRCVRCKERKQHADFGSMPSGKRREHCKGCEAPPRVNMKTCKGCHRTLPRNANFSRRNGPGFRLKCRACLPDGPTMRSCKGCGKEAPLETFPRFKDGSRKYHCESCCKPKINFRKCKRCSQIKPLRAEFPIYVSKDGKAYHRGLTCNVCIVAYHAKRAGVPKVSPHPCSHCGEKFTSYRSAYSASLIKYCSTGCRRAAATTKTHHECQRCCAVLPVDKFDFRSNTKSIRDTCRNCIELVQQGKFGQNRTRISVRQMRTYLKKSAGRFGIDNVASEAQLARRIDNGCDLCASDTYTFMPRVNKEDYIGDNLVAVCIECRKASSRLGVDPFLFYCISISQGPLAKKIAKQPPLPVVTKTRPPTKRQQAIEKTKAKQIHPLSPLAAPIGETFEQQLARLSQARADKLAALDEMHQKKSKRTFEVAEDEHF